MIAAIQRTLVGRMLAALAALAILVGGWHAATAHGGGHDHAHHAHVHEHAHDPAAGATQDASHTAHDRIDHDHPQGLATARRASPARTDATRLAVAHQGSPPQRSDAPFRPPRG